MDNAEHVNPDLLRRLADPLMAAVGPLLRPLDLSPQVQGALLALSSMSVVLVLLGAIVVICPPIGTRLAARRPTAGLLLLLALVGLPALALLSWLAHRPSTAMDALVLRWDHLVFAALAGCALRVLPEALRTWSLAILSIALLAHMTGVAAIAISLVYALLGRGVVQLPGTRRAWTVVALEAALLVLALFACWRTHLANYFLGLAAQGTLAFVALRHLSWVIDTRRGVRGSLGEYLCYLFFYPSCLGSVELYADFLERNRPLGGRHYDYRLAAWKFFVGGLQMWAAGQVPATINDLLASSGFLAAWGLSLGMFVRASLFLMGFWSVVDCIALLYGMQLRPNFARLFSVENPSQFWYAWRGTMTRWLVQYVYIPLGGNRHAQVRNIFAAFAVSCLWHWSGVSFLHYDTGPLDYVPIVAWATVNASVISASVVWRRHGGRILPATTPTVVRRGLHRFGTMCFGSVTATFLGFHGELVPHFPRFVLRLLGM